MWEIICIRTWISKCSAAPMKMWQICADVTCSKLTLGLEQTDRKILDPRSRFSVCSRPGKQEASAWWQSLQFAQFGPYNGA